MRMQQRYTLIELLVTIAIISILASMLVTALKYSQEKIKDMNCKNNLKNLGIISSLYIADHNGKYVPCQLEQHYTWDDIFGDYDGRNLTETEKEGQGHTKVTDPDFERGLEMYQCENDTIDYGDQYKRTYSINNLGDGSDGPFGGITGGDGLSVRIGAVQEPSNTILMSEYVMSKSRMGSTWCAGIRLPRFQLKFSGQFGLLPETGLTGTHGDYMYSYLLTDGRVKFYDLTETCSNYTAGPNGIDGMWSVKADD